MAAPDVAPHLPPAPPKQRWQILRILDLAWNNRLFAWLVWLTCAVWGAYWWLHIPSPGKAAIFLAVAAAIMSALGENLKVLAKLCWVLMMFGLLAVEYQAINKDRKESQEQLTAHFEALSKQADENLKATLKSSNDNLKTILEDEHKSFSNILSDQQRGFINTVNQIVKNDQNENKRFAELLSEQQNLFSKQLELAATLNGRLLPAGDPTPSNACEGSNMPSLPGQMTVIMPHSAFVNNQFSHTILEVNDKSIIGIKHQADGSLALLVNMTLEDGRVVFKLDESGVRAINGLFLLRPDKSTVLVEDPAGGELFRARYINSGAFSIEGKAIAEGREYKLDKPPRMCVLDSYIDIRLHTSTQR